MIERRTFLAGAVLLAAPLAAEAQPKAPRVGVLVGAAAPHPFADVFRRGLQGLGYQEGQNIVLEIRYTGGQADRAAELAAELVRLRVDVIVAPRRVRAKGPLGLAERARWATRHVPGRSCAVRRSAGALRAAGHGLTPGAAGQD